MEDGGNSGNDIVFVRAENHVKKLTVSEKRNLRQVFSPAVRSKTKKLLDKALALRSKEVLAPNLVADDENDFTDFKQSHHRLGKSTAPTKSTKNTRLTTKKAKSKAKSESGKDKKDFNSLEGTDNSETFQRSASLNLEGPVKVEICQRKTSSKEKESINVNDEVFVDGKEVGRKKCHICDEEVSETSLKMHLQNCLKARFEHRKKGSGDEAKPDQSVDCPVCGKDLVLFGLMARAEHMNKCLDQVENTNPGDDDEEEFNKLLQSARNAVMGCPMCGKKLQTVDSRTKHLKQCAIANKMSVEQVRNLIGQQREEYHNQLDAGVLPQDFRIPAKPSKPKGTRKPSKFVEDVQLAKVLSTSMEEFQPGENNARLAVQKALTKPDGGKKSKQEKSKTLLLSLTKEEANERISNQVASLIFNKSPEDGLSKTPSFKNKKTSKSDSLWSKTSIQTLALSEVDISASSSISTQLASLSSLSSSTSLLPYYVHALMPSVSVSTVVPGSKVRRCSQIPGRGKLFGPSDIPDDDTTNITRDDQLSTDMPVSPSASPSPSSPRTQQQGNVSPSQTVGILAELAEEHESLDNGDLDEFDLVEKNETSVDFVSQSDNPATRCGMNGDESVLVDGGDEFDLAEIKHESGLSCNKKSEGDQNMIRLAEECKTNDNDNGFDSVGSLENDFPSRSARADGDQIDVVVNQEMETSEDQDGGGANDNEETGVTGKKTSVSLGGDQYKVSRKNCGSRIASDTNSHGSDVDPRQENSEGSGHDLLESLSSCLLSLVDNPRCSDIKIKVRQAGVISAHRNILIARCPLLLDMCIREESGPVIDLLDFDKDSVLWVLKYIYGGRMETHSCQSLREEIVQLAKRLHLGPILKMMTKTSDHLISDNDSSRFEQMETETIQDPVDDCKLETGLVANSDNGPEEPNNRKICPTHTNTQNHKRTDPADDCKLETGRFINSDNGPEEANNRRICPAESNTQSDKRTVTMDSGHEGSSEGFTVDEGLNAGMGSCQDVNDIGTAGDACGKNGDESPELLNDNDGILPSSWNDPDRIEDRNEMENVVSKEIMTSKCDTVNTEVEDESPELFGDDDDIFWSSWNNLDRKDDDDGLEKGNIVSEKGSKEVVSSNHGTAVIEDIEDVGIVNAVVVEAEGEGKECINTRVSHSTANGLLNTMDGSSDVVVDIDCNNISIGNETLNDCSSDIGISHSGTSNVDGIRMNHKEGESNSKDNSMAETDVVDSSALPVTSEPIQDCTNTTPVSMELTANVTPAKPRKRRKRVTKKEFDEIIHKVDRETDIRDDEYTRILVKMEQMEKQYGQKDLNDSVYIPSVLHDAACQDSGDVEITDAVIPPKRYKKRRRNEFKSPAGTTPKKKKMSSGSNVAMETGHTPTSTPCTAQRMHEDSRPDRTLESSFLNRDNGRVEGVDVGPVLGGSCHNGDGGKESRLTVTQSDADVRALNSSGLLFDSDNDLFSSGDEGPPPPKETPSTSKVINNSSSVPYSYCGPSEKLECLDLDVQSKKDGVSRPLPVLNVRSGERSQTSSVAVSAMMGQTQSVRNTVIRSTQHAVGQKINMSSSNIPFRNYAGACSISETPPPVKVIQQLPVLGKTNRKDSNFTGGNPVPIDTFTERMVSLLGQKHPTHQSSHPSSTPASSLHKGTTLTSTSRSLSSTPLSATQAVTVKKIPPIRPYDPVSRSSFSSPMSEPRAKNTSTSSITQVSTPAASTTPSVWSHDPLGKSSFSSPDPLSRINTPAVSNAPASTCVLPTPCEKTSSQLIVERYLKTKSSSTVKGVIPTSIDSFTEGMVSCLTQKQTTLSSSAKSSPSPRYTSTSASSGLMSFSTQSNSMCTKSSHGDQMTTASPTFYSKANSKPCVSSSSSLTSTSSSSSSSSTTAAIISSSSTPSSDAGQDKGYSPTFSKKKTSIAVSVPQASPLSLRERLGLVNPFGPKSSGTDKPLPNQPETVKPNTTNRVEPPGKVAQVKSSKDGSQNGNGTKDNQKMMPTKTLPDRKENNKKNPMKAAVKRTDKVASPFTPMAPYDDMNTPDLKKAVGKVGVRPMGKKRMRDLLKHIYKETHQYETDSDDGNGSTPVKRPNPNAPRKEALEFTDLAKRQLLLATKSPEKRIAQGSGSGSGHRLEKGIPKPSTSASVTDFSDEQGGGEDDILSSQDSSFSDGPDFPEESMLQVLPEEEDVDAPCTQLTQTSMEVLNNRLMDFLKDNPKIYEQILMYDALELDVLKKQISDAGIRVGYPKLQDFLDERCITFSMKNMSNRNNRQRQQKKKKGNSPYKRKKATKDKQSVT